MTAKALINTTQDKPDPKPAPVIRHESVAYIDRDVSTDALCTPDLIGLRYADAGAGGPLDRPLYAPTGSMVGEPGFMGYARIVQPGAFALP